MLACGDVIRGKYRLIRILGDGGMGTVYEASHELLGTRVAIKVLHADLARRTGLIDRFMQEARVAAQIKSQHVVQVTDIDRTPEGIAYIVMELLEGEALSAMLDRQGRLPVATACDFARQILEALEAAHALGVVHRDLKPENVFVTYANAKPVLKLIDFGIAKLRSNVPGEKALTVAGVLMGTAEYMAPEQAASADRVDARSDVYAVGVMLYEMIAAARPVAGEDARVIAMKVERGEAIPLVTVVPDVPREIAGLVHRAMAARPELRFPSAMEMRLALEGALSGKRSPTVPLPKHETATVQAAPVAAAFGERSTPPMDAPPRTERAGPAPMALTPMHASTQAASPILTPMPGGRGRGRRKRRSLTWLWVTAPLLLGGAAVAAWIATQSSGTAPIAAPIPTPTPTPTAAAAPTATAPPTPAPLDTVAPLVPSPHVPAPIARTGDAGRPPHAPGAPSAIPSPSDPTFPFPIPSAFPFPLPTFGGGDGGAPPLFPFPIPSGLPSTLPSTLPFQIPPPPSAAPSPPPTSTL